MKKKRLYVIAFACCLTLSMFSGCGKKDVDYNVGEDGSSDGSGGEGLAGKLGVPETIDESLDVGDSGLTSLTIEATEVHMPDTDHMSVVYCTKNEMTAERKQEIAELLFDKDEGIYAYDYDNRIKSEIQAELDWCEEEREIEAAEGYDTSWLDEYESELQSELASAPEQYPAAEDYEGDDYLGTYNGTEYKLSMYEDGNVYLIFNGDELQYRPTTVEGATDAYFTYDEDDTDMESNVCEMSETDAETLALTLLGELGVSDAVKKSVYPLEWVYYGDSNVVSEEKDGYVFEFARSIDGATACDIGVWNVLNLDTDDGYPDIPVESFYVYVDSNGILELDFQDIFTPTGEVDSDIELLSFSELIEQANTSVAQYYTDYPTDYAKIEFNGAYLTYYISIDEENDQYMYIPVWVFTEYEEYQDDDWSSYYPDQMVVLDARDGSYIDIVQLSKDLGTFESYYEADDDEIEFIE